MITIRFLFRISIKGTQKYWFLTQYKSTVTHSPRDKCTRIVNFNSLFPLNAVTTYFNSYRYHNVTSFASSKTPSILSDFPDWLKIFRAVHVVRQKIRAIKNLTLSSFPLTIVISFSVHYHFTFSYCFTNKYQFSWMFSCWIDSLKY